MIEGDLGGGRSGGKRRRGREGEIVPVTSYTPSSTMMYIPESASLCDATSATVNCWDIFFLGDFEFRFAGRIGGVGCDSRTVQF